MVFFSYSWCSLICLTICHRSKLFQTLTIYSELTFPFSSCNSHPSILLLFLWMEWWHWSFQVISSQIFKSLSVVLSSHQCKVRSLYYPSSSHAPSIVFEGIMIYRVSSMYNNERKIITLLFTALVIEWVTVIVILLLNFKIKVRKWNHLWITPRNPFRFLRCSFQLSRAQHQVFTCAPKIPFRIGCTLNGSQSPASNSLC